MFLISFIIVYIVSSSTVVALPENETEHISNAVDDSNKTEINRFLEQIQEKPDIITKIVKTNEGENSIKNFFESSLQSGTTENNTSKWQITNQDINKTRFLINIVVSCEYSEYTYFLVQLITKAIAKVLKDDVVRNRDVIKEFLFKPIKPVLSDMILTLVGLLKYAKNDSLKNQEILNILLSWYVYIMNSGFVQKDAETNNIEVYHIDYITVINYQAEKYLKIFILNNCRNVEKYQQFKTGIDSELGTLSTIDDFKNLLGKKLEELNPLLDKTFLQKTHVGKNLFVLTPSSSYSLALRNWTGVQTTSTIVTIKWNNENIGLSQTYNSYISDNANGIKSLLKYEKILLETITKIINGYLVNELAYIITDSQMSERKLITDIQEKIISILDYYKLKFLIDGQPLYLINNMSIIITDLWRLCNNNMSFEDKKIEIRKYIFELNKSKLDIPINAGLSKLREFLDKISGMVICAKLHPSVTNVYWAKMYFAPTNISDYIVDLKHLHRKHEVIHEDDKTMCYSYSYISDKLKAIENQISVCESEMKSDNSARLTTCMNDLNTNYTKLKTKIEDLVSITDRVYSFNLKKILLSVVYYLDYVESFAIHENEKKKKIIQDLKVLQTSIVENFDVGFFVMCKSEPVYNEEVDTKLNSSETTRSQDEYSRRLNLKLADINSYHDLFKNIDEYIGKLIASHIEPELTVYWDGFRMTLGEVHDMYRLRLRDQLQINYDYFSFLFRWAISVVYSRIIQIVKEIIASDTSDLSPRTLSRVFFVDDLELIFKEYKKLPLNVSMPVSNTLDRFVYVLRTYDGVNNENLNNYINILEFELEKLGFIPSTTTTIKKYTYSVYIDVFIQTISDLISIYNTQKNTLENAVTSIGIDLKDLIMMFHEWN